MKKSLSVVLACVFCLGAISFAGCGDPCEKAVDKMIECMGEEEGGKKIAEGMKKKRDEMVKECKEDKDKIDQLKKCNKESDCKKFMKCLMKQK